MSTYTPDSGYTGVLTTISTIDSTAPEQHLAESSKQITNKIDEQTKDDADIAMEVTNDVILPCEKTQVVVEDLVDDINHDSTSVFAMEEQACINYSDQIEKYPCLSDNVSDSAEDKEKNISVEPSNSKDAIISSDVCSSNVALQKIDTISEHSNYNPTTGDNTSIENDNNFVANYVLAPRLVSGAYGEFRSFPENFLKGSKWSPCGSCILTCSNDNCLRVFNPPQEVFRGKTNFEADLKAITKVAEGDLVYDFAWYPGMDYPDPVSCCFVSSCRDNPIHLWDSLTGELRCSYRPYNQMDEIAPAYSLAFDSTGQKLYCGFEKMIRVFNISRPGRDCSSRPTFAKQGQPGIISCISVNPVDDKMYAAGSYSRSVGIYSEPKGDLMCVLMGQQGGVTHLKFSADGNRLYSGGRKDPEILCWDVRNPGRILHTLHRKVTTNQRIYFDFDSTSQYLMSGNQDGQVLIWDTTAVSTNQVAEPVLLPITKFGAHRETVNSISCHPSLPVVVTGSGQRHFPMPSVGSDSDESDTESATDDNSMKIWWFGR